MIMRSSGTLLSAVLVIWFGLVWLGFAYHLALAMISDSTL